MGDVIGPNSYLPGHKLPVPEKVMCDKHPDRLAVARIVGECDSFGSELNDCCQECVDEIRNAPPHTGTCDWCKTRNVVVKDHRDYEEGSCGRVYQVCQTCRDREAKRFLEENPIDDFYDYDYD